MPDRQFPTARRLPQSHGRRLRLPVRGAVNSEQRLQGTGRQLVAAAEAVAAEVGIEQLYLLTETAQAWFAQQGYEPLDRALLPESLTASAEFRGACPETAVAMRRAPMRPDQDDSQAAPAQA